MKETNNILVNNYSFNNYVFINKINKYNILGNKLFS